MATVKVYDQNKQESGEMTLASDVFEIEVRPEILNLVVRAQMAAKRAGTHNAKTRAFVSGGGAIIFGPSPRDYGFKVNSKVRALALKMALSSRLAGESLLVVKGIELPEAKTKHFAKVAGALGLGKALIVTPEDNEALSRSARNIPGLTLTTPDRLSVLDVLKHKQLVLLEGAVESVQARFAKKGA